MNPPMMAYLGIILVLYHALLLTIKIIQYEKDHVIIFVRNGRMHGHGPATGQQRPEIAKHSTERGHATEYDQ